MQSWRNLLLQVCTTFSITCLCYSLKYSTIKEANASCFPQDSCKTPRDVEIIEGFNCDCSKNCEDYKTCCIDSPYLNNSTRKSSKFSSTSCVSVGQGSVSVFMVTTCHRNYNGPPDIRRKCEDDGPDYSDPFAFAPVTNIESRVTYKSLFCAICNFEKQLSLSSWQVMLECSSLGEFIHLCRENRDFVLNNIMYIKDKEMWGLWSWDKKSDWKFRFLPIIYNLPENLNPHVKPCRPDLNSECSTTWNDPQVKRHCRSYMGAVYFPQIAFRNIHCAMCNHVIDFSKMTCNPMHASPFRSPTSLSFGLLLDFDLSEGDTVGKTDKCGRGQIYDPFSKKCRTIECPLPGFVVKEGKCFREDTAS